MRSAPPGTVQAHGVRQWWLNRSLRTKGLIVVAVPLIALLGLTSANLLLQQNESTERNISLNARNLDDTAAQVLADMVNGETGVRGYAATRDPTFLDPYNLMLTRIGAERTALRQAAVIAGDGGQQQAVDATTGQELFELAQLRSAISRGTSAGNLLPALQAGKTTMDLLRRQVASLAAGPAALVALQHNKITTQQTRTEQLDIAGLVLGLLAGLAGVALFTSSIARRVSMNAENARRLGEGQPLEPILVAGDEIGRLAESHLRAEALLASRSAELMAARDAAMRATRAKNAFLSSTSHELRTPLNSILGFAQLLQLSELSEDDRDGVDRILGAGHHLLALINELIDIARIESGDLGMSLEPVLVRPLIEESCRLMAPIAAARSIRIIRDCAYPALTVFADRQRLAQVLVNLISNAVKYNHRDGSITISCAEAGTGQASIVVTDTGPGLAPEDLERIFVPFERLGAERTDGRGHRDRAASGQSPHRGHGRPPDRIERPWSGSGFHRQPSPRPRPDPRPGPQPRASGTGGQAARSARSRPQRSLHRGQPGERRGNSPVPKRQVERNAPVRDIWPGRPRVRRPGGARHHPARPAPARPAGRRGTERTQG